MSFIIVYEMSLEKLWGESSDIIAAVCHWMEGQGAAQ